MSKWALVTGSAQRIGRAIAFELAEGGWNIIVHYNSSRAEASKTAEGVKKRKREVHLVKSDLTDKRATENLIPALVKKVGPIAALVNNASLFQPDAHAPGGHDHKAVNVEAPLLLIEALRKQIPKGESGAVVNILDGCLPELGFANYVASKKSLRVMTIELARRYAPELRINGVAPGPVLQAQRQSAAHFKKLIQATLLKAEISPEAVAQTVLFLVDNPSITGEILHIDGGIRLKNTPSLQRALAS